MKKTLMPVPATALFVLICCLQSYPGEVGQNKRMDVMKRMVEERKKNISFLIETLTEGTQSHSREEIVQCIVTLGELRAVEAVDLLVKNIDFKGSLTPLEGGGAWVDQRKAWPAKHALVQIGLPSVKPLIMLMVESDDEEKLNLAETATAQILGYNMRNAYLRELMQKTKDDTTIERLRSFIAE